MLLDTTTGLMTGVEWKRSPNYDDRPSDVEVDTLIIHSISLPPGCFGGDHVARLFTNQLEVEFHPSFENLRGLRVSAHFLVDRQGMTTQFVPTGKRAWHAGQSRFRGRNAANDFSIGIELEGCDEKSFEEEQYRSLTELSQVLLNAYPAITMDRITGHSDIAPDRKTDPGPFFDWSRYLDSLRFQY